jgi:long-subunit fatty acid transport protein
MIKSLIFLLLSTSFVFSQTEKPKREYFMRFNLSKDFYKTHYLQHSSFTSKLEYRDLNFSTSLLVFTKISKKLDMGIGIGYSNQDLKSTYFCSNCQYIQKPMPKIDKMRILEIPIWARYNFTKTKLRPHVDINLIPVLKFNTDSGDVFLKNKHLAFSFGAGANYAISKSTNLGLTIYYKTSYWGNYIAKFRLFCINGEISVLFPRKK